VIPNYVSDTLWTSRMTAAAKMLGVAGIMFGAIKNHQKIISV
jgi:hypothetical protein